MSQPIVVAQDDGMLRALVQECVKRDGVACDLNHIDVSNVVVFNTVFANSPFNGDISAWDVSNATRMQNMFAGSQFNGDISGWNVSNVQDMGHMFQNSCFNGDISRWDVAKVNDAACMFADSPFNGDVSQWKTLSLWNADDMFFRSAFNQDVSRWLLPNLHHAESMFTECPFAGDLSRWSLPKMDLKRASRMLSAGFKGVPPLFGETFEQRRRYYYGVFNEKGSGVAGLAHYLNTQPFNAVHADVALHSRIKPGGMSKADYAWVCQVKQTGLALGMNDHELRGHLLAHYATRGQKDVVLDIGDQDLFLEPF